MRNIPWKPISISLLILFTLLSCRLLPWGAKKENGYRLSNHQGNFTSFIETAQRQNSPAIIDKDVEISSPVHVHGDITLKGENQPTITANVHSKFNELFHLHEGRHFFSGFDIQQDSNSTAFLTARQEKIIWQNEFDQVNILSGREAYSSSRGGLWDEANDSILQWSGTVWKNSTISVGRVPITIFSQDGPAKYLHLENMTIQNGDDFGNARVAGRKQAYVSHTLYCHPNVSLRFNNVTLKPGKLALHHFSGGGVPGKNRYVELYNVQSPNKGVELSTPKSTPIQLENCHFGIYTPKHKHIPEVIAKNCYFDNVGDGAVSGTLIACKGEIGSGGKGLTLTLKDCQLDHLSLQLGGQITVINSTINKVTGANPGKKAQGTFKNCQINILSAKDTNTTFIFEGTSEAKRIKAPTGVIRKR